MLLARSGFSVKVDHGSQSIQRVLGKSMVSFLQCLGPSRIRLIKLDVAHALLDLYITILTTPNTELTNPSTPSPVSPRDAPSPSHPTSSSNLSNNPTASLAFPLSTFWTGQTLTELKIHLRDKMPGNAVTRGWVGVEMELNEELEGTVDGMGKNDGTVRFLWDPEPVRGA